MKLDLFGAFVRVLPRAFVSYWFGVFSRIESPRWFSKICVCLYANLFKINFAELDRELVEFKSLAQLFTRPLKPGVRPLASGLVSPVDGVLRAAGEITNGEFVIAKGVPYSVTKLLGRPNFTESFLGGNFINFYLSPKDYHHIHAPMAGEVVYSGHIPGALWPVNDWALFNIPELFSVNERHVIVINTQRGLMAVVMIAALNVGGITLSSKISFGAKVAGGERLANFELGSAVIVLLAPGFLLKGLLPEKTPRSVRMGELIGL